MSVYKILAVPAAIVASTTFAFAGGYTAPVVQPVPVVVAPETQVSYGDWAGTYAGASLGYVFGKKDEVGFSTPQNQFLGNYGNEKISGVQGGLHIGYRMQRDAWVFGAELGYDVSGADDTVSFDNANGKGEVTSEVNNVIALRFKTGRVIDDKTMVYGVAGIARGDFTYSGEGQYKGHNITGETDYKSNGWILGLGVERKLNEKISLTGAIEHAGFKKKEVALGDTVSRATPKYNMLRLGVNYRF